MKNSFKFSALLFMMTGILIVPAKAASTEVTIGVTEAPPKVVSVDVPKSFAIAVVADQRIPDNKPVVLVGSTTAAAGDPTIDFFNRGKEEAIITEAKIQDSVYSKWTLSTDIPNKSQVMNIKFGDFSLATEVGIGGEGRMYGKALQLPANTTTRITTEAVVGGANRDYPNQEHDAVSYYVSWIIEAK